MKLITSFVQYKKSRLLTNNFYQVAQIWLKVLIDSLMHFEKTFTTCYTSKNAIHPESY